MATHKRLTQIDREHIMVLLRQEYKPSHIASKMIRHRSVISREIKRNSLSSESYSAYTAQYRADRSASESFPESSYSINCNK
jgi:IS30 family transposase